VTIIYSGESFPSARKISHVTEITLNLLCYRWSFDVFQTRQYRLDEIGDFCTLQIVSLDPRKKVQDNSNVNFSFNSEALEL
jgi:hypothetical protein